MNAPLSLPEAARRADTSPTSLRRWISTGALKAAKDKNGGWLIREEDLRAYMVTILASKKSSSGAPKRKGAETSSTTASTMDPTVAVLTEALQRERHINDELRGQNKELQGEILKLTAEMRAILSKEGAGMLSRWMRK
jgi:DNA-binding transcriptional MerR regulator